MHDNIHTHIHTSHLGTCGLYHQVSRHVSSFLVLSLIF